MLFRKVQYSNNRVANQNGSMSDELLTFFFCSVPPRTIVIVIHYLRSDFIEHLRFEDQ